MVSLYEKRGNNMKRIKRKFSDSKGFSLVELIIVIAIMAIIAGALAPTLIKYIEKSKRAKDIANAQAIETVMIHAFSDGTMEVPEGLRKQGYGAWVMMCRGDKSYAPSPYHGKNFNGVWCGADKGVIIDGHASTADWNYCTELYNFLKSEGVNIDNAKTKASSKNGGWDWIIVQVCVDNDGRLCSRIYSGFKNEDGGNFLTPESNIERMMERGWIPIE